MCQKLKKTVAIRKEKGDISTWKKDVGRICRIDVLSNRRCSGMRSCLLCFAVLCWGTIAAVPTANSQAISVSVTGASALTLTGSSLVPNNLVFTVLTAPTKGTLSGTAPYLSYTPTGSVGETDSFTFKVNDGTGDSAPATVYVFLDGGVGLQQSLHCYSFMSVNCTLTAADIDSNRGPGIVTNSYLGSGPAEYFPQRVWDSTLTTTISSVNLVSLDGQGAASIPASTQNSQYNEFLASNAASTSPFFTDPVSLVVAVQPAHGTLTIKPQPFLISFGLPTATYTPNIGYMGTDQVAINYLMDGNIVATGMLTITVLDFPPTVQAGVPSGVYVAGDIVPLFATGLDPDATALTYLWDFGDGTTSTDQNPTHTYAAGGVYNATVTVTDIGGLTSTSKVSVVVFNATDEPTAQFVTSSINGIVGQPLGFDATFSTDPANNISNYLWDFGDGTPTGGGVVISHIYTSKGTYTASLTVTNANGLTNTFSASIVVLSPEQAAVTQTFVKYTAKLNRTSLNSDSLTLDAQVNVGDLTITGTTPLGVAIAGAQFTGHTGGAGSTRSAGKKKTEVKWIAKAVKGSSGTYSFKAQVRNATLLGFPTATATFTTPVTLTVDTRIFSTPVATKFRFATRGGTATGGN
jgi:PKD repeat protein